MKSHHNKFLMAVLVPLAFVAALFIPQAAVASARKDSNTLKPIFVFKQMVDKLGGLDAILAIRCEQIIATGKRYEPEQPYEPNAVPLHVADYELMQTRDFQAQRLRLDWMNNIQYPLTIVRTHSEVINGDLGAVFGVDTLFPPQLSAAPMFSTRLAMRLKQHLMSSPHYFVRHALNHLSDLKYDGRQFLDGRAHYVFSIPGLIQPIRAFIDAKSSRLTKIDTLEDDPVYGDARLEMRFDDWRRTGGLVAPYRMRYIFNGKLINDESRSAISFNVALDDTMFAVPGPFARPLEPEQFAWGDRSSQWFARMLAMGAPFDFDQSLPQSIFFLPIMPGVFHIIGGSHNSLLVEMNDFLVLSDPVLYDSRTQAIIAAAAARWPNKPIKYVVVTHFHEDHIGGIRGYGAIGATIVTGAGTRGYVEDIFLAPHTVYPDAYMLHPRTIDIVSVDVNTVFEITDGMRNVQVFNLPNIHSADTLMTYIPDSAVAFVSDVYNPGLPAPIPPQFDQWAIDFYNSLLPLGLNIGLIAGGHGLVFPYSQFIADIQATLGAPIPVQ